MNYKTILLAILLVPLAAIGKDTSTARIQQMEEKLFQKELELSNLGAVITEKNELISFFKSEIQDFFKLIIDQRAKELKEKNGGKSLSPEEEALLSTELTGEQEEFFEHFIMTCKNKTNSTGMLTDGLFKKGEFEPLKFYALRCVVEQRILKKIIKKYEVLMQELIAIEVELENFKK